MVPVDTAPLHSPLAGGRRRAASRASKTATILISACGGSMDTSGRSICSKLAGDTDRDYSGLCLDWDVILTDPVYAEHGRIALPR